MLTAEAQRTQRLNRITGEIVGAAIEVHKYVGPGLLESIYDACLARELTLRKLPFERQKALDVEYKSAKLTEGYRIDFLVCDSVVVEVKTVEDLAPIHDAQLLTYLRLTGCNVGLLINFNVPVLKRGIRRLVLNLRE